VGGPTIQASRPNDREERHLENRKFRLDPVFDFEHLANPETRA
jgi:hypothetical protein